MRLMGVKSGLKITEKDSENLELLNILDLYFLKKRGYAAKMPQAGESIAVCMSGGLDSTANIAILIKEFGLKVYSFFINRGQSCYKHEKISVEFYDNFFKKEFPNLYRGVCEIKIDTPPLAYKNLLTHERTTNHISYPSRNSVIFLTGAEYAYSLKTKDVNIKTVFAAHVSSDNSFHCSQTWTRITNLTICHIMNDYNWQFISLPIETAFGNYFDKDILIKFCVENNIPLEFARTCVKDSEIPCGKCPPCWERRRIYRDLGLKENVEYLHPMPKDMPIYY